MKQHTVQNILQADMFYVERGAVAFFDSHFPLLFAGDVPKIYSRYYFNSDGLRLGDYKPELWRWSHISIHVHTKPMPMLNHPKLTLLVDK